MPNRILKESICRSPTIDELSPLAENFFYRLIVNCDDFGRFDARPEVLRAACFPLRLRTVSSTKIDEWIGRLEAAELLFLYESDGRPYLQLTNWEKHQQRRATNSKFPDPSSNGSQRISSESDGNQKSPYSRSRTYSRSRSENEKKTGGSAASGKFTDDQDHLLRTLLARNPDWGEVTPAYVTKLNKHFGTPAVTEALQDGYDADVNKPAAWLRSVCEAKAKAGQP